MTAPKTRMRWPIDLWFDEAMMPRWPTRLSRFITDLEDEYAPFTNWKPAIDVKETDKEYLITVDLPGVDPKDIEVSMERGMLTISGERKTETRDAKNGYQRVERFEGSFFRRLQLRDAADDADVSADAKGGVLTVHVPKAAGSRARKVQVKSA